MPAYSFKERFVLMVQDGSKPGTIRAFRKHAPRVGQLAHLFWGMRTKFCKKLKEPSPAIREVYCIFISENAEVGIIRDINWIEPDLCDYLKLHGKKEVDNYFGPLVKWLSADEKDMLAWQDGFRQEGKGVLGAFAFMIMFWMTTHTLPFAGNYILWGESKVKLKK